MGLLSDLAFWRTPEVLSHVVEPSEVFDSIIGQDNIPPEFFGLSSYADATAPAPRMDRRSAIQVPAVKRGRDLIAGTLGTLPIDLLGRDNALVTVGLDRLTKQPEAGIPRSVTLARTFEDLLFEGVAWWLVTETGWNNFPVKVKRLDPRSVDVKKDGKIYITKMGHHGQVTEYADDFDLIRFDSPNEALLSAGARAIRTSLRLDQAAEMYAGGNQPLDYFTPADNFDPDQTEVDAAMDMWDLARRKNATGYVPAALKYNTAGWNPEQLQLANARQHAVLELARVMGVDAEELSVPVTSRTYQNQQDRRKQFVDFTLMPYAKAVEERLSMDDVTPRGYNVRFNFSEFMRSDDLTRVQVAAQGIGSKVLTESEGRNYFDPNLPVQVKEADQKEIEDAAA